MSSTRSASDFAQRLFRAVVTGLVLLVGLATLLGVLDRVWWVFELADVFRLQYLAVLVVSAVVALALRRPQLAVLAARLASSWGYRCWRSPSSRRSRSFDVPIPQSAAPGSPR